MIIPAFNRAATLPRCIRSVWSQQPALPAEVIVVDDGSSDDTAEVAASHGARVIRHPENYRFAARARNTGLYATECEWIAFLDSDDEWLPNHLAHLWELRDGHALVGSSALRCSSNPAHDRFHGPISRRPVVLRDPKRLALNNVFSASASMIRRDVALRLGGFQLWWGVEDFDLWIRVLEHYTAVCSPRVTVLYHAHDDQISSDETRMVSGHREVLLAHQRRTGASRIALERRNGVAAWDLMRLHLRRRERLAAARDAPSIVANIHRLSGVLTVLWERFMERRFTSRVGRDGEPSIAVLVSDQDRREKVMASLTGRTVHDLSQFSSLGALQTLARRPAGLAIVESRRQAMIIRALGTRATIVRGCAAGHRSADAAREDAARQ